MRQRRFGPCKLLIDECGEYGSFQDRDTEPNGVMWGGRCAAGLEIIACAKMAHLPSIDRLSLCLWEKGVTQKNGIFLI